MLRSSGLWSMMTHYFFANRTTFSASPRSTGTSSRPARSTLPTPAPACFCFFAGPWATCSPAGSSTASKPLSGPRSPANSPPRRMADHLRRHGQVRATRRAADAPTRGTGVLAGNDKSPRPRAGSKNAPPMALADRAFGGPSFRGTAGAGRSRSRRIRPLAPARVPARERPAHVVPGPRRALQAGGVGRACAPALSPAASDRLRRRAAPPRRRGSPA